MPLYDDDGNELTPQQALEYLQQQGQTPDPQAPQTQTPGWRRDLEQRANKSTELQQQLDAANRELAFAKAGIPLAQDPANPNPLLTYFVTGYSGEMTPEAIRAEAAKLNLVAPAPNGQQQPTQQAPTNPYGNLPADQAGAFQRIGEAVQGQAAPAGRDWDAEKEAAPDRATLHRIVQEQAQAEGRQTPAIVFD